MRLFKLFRQLFHLLIIFRVFFVRFNLFNLTFFKQDQLIFCRQLLIFCSKLIIFSLELLILGSKLIIFCSKLFFKSGNLLVLHAFYCIFKIFLQFIEALLDHSKVVCKKSSHIAKKLFNLLTDHCATWLFYIWKRGLYDFLDFPLVMIEKCLREGKDWPENAAKVFSRQSKLFFEQLFFLKKLPDVIVNYL